MENRKLQATHVMGSWNQNHRNRVERRNIADGITRGEIVDFRKKEVELLKSCCACGMDHTNYKEALQCCAYIE